MAMVKRKCRNCDDNVYKADINMDPIHVGSDNYICTRREFNKRIITAAE